MLFWKRNERNSSTTPLRLQPERAEARDRAREFPNDLTGALQQVLAPVRPRPDFRAELARELAAVARQKRSPQIVLQQPRRHRGILIGAAVSSAVSMAGLIALIWHQRTHATARRAA